MECPETSKKVYDLLLCVQKGFARFYHLITGFQKLFELSIKIVNPLDFLLQAGAKSGSVPYTLAKVYHGLHFCDTNDF